MILGSADVAVERNCIGGIFGAQAIAHPVGTGILVGAGSSDVLMEFNLLLATRGSSIELANGAPPPSRVC